MRHTLAAGLLLMGAIGKFLFSLAALAAIIAMWIPIGGEIIGEPVSALWLIPFGMLLTPLIALLFGLFWNLLALPFMAVTVWLAKDEVRL